MGLEQAARQALVALEDVMSDFDGSWALADTAIAALREALAEPQITTPDVCGEVCARAKLCYGCNKDLEEANAKYAEQAEHEPVAWQGAEEWEPLAFQLCADENGEESCNELLWDGGVIPEPWGERWLKYEDEAKRMIEYVRKYAAPVRTKDLTDDEIHKCMNGNFYNALDFARAVIAADREKNK